MDGVAPTEAGTGGPVEEAGGCAREVAAAPLKPFLGGFRNRLSGAEYHHACTQTPPPAAEAPVAGPHVCTGAQTTAGLARAAQTHTDAATQCPRPGWHEDTSHDRVLLPKGE